MAETETTEIKGSDQQQQEQQGASISLSEARKYQETTATKFFTLDSAIQNTLDKTAELMKAPQERYGGISYLCFGEQNNDEFKKMLRDINRCIAEAQVLFDSDIKLEKSSPKFENYQNLFYLLFETCITRHSESIFFQVHARDKRYLYPHKPLSVGLDKISMLLSRVQGALKKSGEYIKDEPLTKSAPSQGTGQFYGGGYGGGYSGGYSGFNPYAPHIGDDSRYPLPDKRKQLKDIGAGTDEGL